MSARKSKIIFSYFFFLFKNKHSKHFRNFVKTLKEKENYMQKKNIIRNLKIFVSKYFSKQTRTSSFCQSHLNFDQ